jgi:hypothetical protein
MYTLRIIAPLVISTYYNGFGQIHALAILLNYVHMDLMSSKFSATL